MINVTLTGRMTARPELRSTSNGKHVTSFSVASDRDYKVNGQRKADFFTVVAWDKTAELVCQYFDKGQWICIVGTAEIREYATPNGEQRKAHEIIAQKISFIGNKSDVPRETSAPAEQNDDYSDVMPNDDDDDLPF